MRVLASVYACSPYDGSERAVGWNWVCELNKCHRITALTSSAYKKDIEDYLEKHPGKLQNTQFVYVEVPNTSWHVGYKHERVYYILWQKYAAKVAEELIKKERYDLVHHITYVTCILPTYMHKLGIPFLYGPVSGGENTPSIIRYPMSKKNKMMETIRYAAQVFFRSTPNYSKTMKKSAAIITTTEETKAIIPRKYHDKVRVFQSIALKSDMIYPEPKRKENDVPRFLMAGRMLYWKGFEIGISAFISALKEIRGGAELVILGNTEDDPKYIRHQSNLMELCGKHLNHEIKFVKSVPFEQMKEFYDGFDVLINCSLRDSGCFVVIEAMSRALPVICVNTGGPKVNTTNESAIKIEPAPLAKMIDEMAEAIKMLASDKEKRECMGLAARKHALESFTLEARTRQMNEFYEEIVKMKE